MTDQSKEFDLSGFETVENLTKGERFYFEDLLLTDFTCIKIESVKVRREGNNFDAIVDISYEVSSKSEQEPTLQTVAYFRRAGLRLPEFSAEPGKLTGDLVDLGGGEELTIEIPENEDFNRQFSIISIEPDSTRTLFTREVVDAFQQNSELTVKTEYGQIAVYQKGQTVPPAEQQSFYTSAREIVDAITRSAATLPADSRRRGEKWVETIQSMNGLMRRMLCKHLVTSQQVNDFLGQSMPRTAPRPIRNFAYGSCRSGMIVGAGIILFGMVFVVLATESEGFLSYKPYLIMLLPLIGIAILFSCGRQWLRHRRLLRNGDCEQAQVVKVEALEISEDEEVSEDEEESEDYLKNDQYFFSAGRKHNVTFETGYGRFTIRVGKQPANLARLLKKRGKATRMLVDTVDPSKVLWIDGLAVDTYI
jgi:hypothetical protein